MIAVYIIFGLIGLFIVIFVIGLFISFYNGDSKDDDGGYDPHMGGGL